MCTNPCFRLLLMVLVVWHTYTPIRAQMFLHEGNVKVGAWELVRELDSVKVYNRTVEGQTLREFKATTVIPVAMPIAVFALNDYQSFGKWMGNNIYDIKAIGQGEKQSYYLYYKVKTPLLSNDRDVVLKIEASSMSKGYIFRCKAMPEYIPEVEGFIRIKRWDAAWILESIDDTSVRISYLGTVNDPDKLPEKYAEEIMTKIPFDCVMGLRQTLSPAK